MFLFLLCLSQFSSSFFTSSGFPVNYINITEQIMCRVNPSSGPALMDSASNYMNDVISDGSVGMGAMNKAVV